ncbi:family 16 glycosylhydrolase [uncultured Bacteroides sp.]|uniref:family 16 glycosylhydrolase n=1 Tax=uncultured Bacteroides sp. TaxID=162156 RepID=UPI0025E230D5|nr:family 16 glycosylhydrolase [uncultured Bacteroides sp.]
MNRYSLFGLLLMLNLFCCSCSSGSDDDLPAVEITVVPVELAFGCGMETRQIEVSSSAEFGVVSSEDWCKCTPAGGLTGKSTLTVSVARNPLETERTAILTFKSGAYKKTLNVRQEKMSGISAPEGYTLVWQDEFEEPRQNGGKPALPNTSEWWYEVADPGWVNNELQRYIANGFIDKDTCAIITDGTLKIVAKKKGNEVISARINTNQSWTYGYFEARLKLPKGKGTWPAFWMMPKNFTSWPDDGEIDIMEEVGYRPNWVSSSIHCKAYYHSIGTQKTAEKFIDTAESDFHIYALEWTADYIKTYVDGQLLFTFNNDKAGDKKTWPFNKPFYLKLNLAWGGDWGGSQGVDQSALPVTYEIDYVRVFQKK